MPNHDWYVAVNGQEQGPLPQEDVRARIVEGRLGPDAYVFTDGMAEWEPVTSRPEFAEIFAPATRPPPPRRRPKPPSPPSANGESDHGSARSSSVFPQGERIEAKTAITPLRTERPELEHRTGPASRIPRRFRKGARGTVRDVQIREISTGSVPQEYLSFRLERTDARGNVVEEIPVELRGSNIKARVLRDGDTAIVLGRRSRRGVVIPRAVYVVNTGASIQVKRHGFFATILALPLGLAFLLAWPALILGVFNEELVGLIPLSLVVMVVFYLVYVRD
jgi:hypothetical protein